MGDHRYIQQLIPYLVVVEHAFGRCWTHQAPNKEVNGEVHWVPKRVLQDLEKNGLIQSRVMIQADQEPATVCVQNVIQELQPDMIPINSPLGEPACNGRVENCVRRVQEKTRTLRSKVER